MSTNVNNSSPTILGYSIDDFVANDEEILEGELKKDKKEAGNDEDLKDKFGETKSDLYKDIKAAKSHVVGLKKGIEKQLENDQLDAAKRKELEELLADLDKIIEELDAAKKNLPEQQDTYLKQNINATGQQKVTLNSENLIANGEEYIITAGGVVDQTSPFGGNGTESGDVEKDVNGDGILNKFDLIDKKQQIILKPDPGVELIPQSYDPATGTLVFKMVDTDTGKESMVTILNAQDTVFLFQEGINPSLMDAYSALPDEVLKNMFWGSGDGIPLLSFYDELKGDKNSTDGLSVMPGYDEGVDFINGSEINGYVDDSSGADKQNAIEIYNQIWLAISNGEDIDVMRLMSDMGLSKEAQAIVLEYLIAVFSVGLDGKVPLVNTEGNMGDPLTLFQKVFKSAVPQAQTVLLQQTENASTKNASLPNPLPENSDMTQSGHTTTAASKNAILMLESYSGGNTLYGGPDAVATTLFPSEKDNSAGTKSLTNGTWLNNKTSQTALNLFKSMSADFGQPLPPGISPAGLNIDTMVKDGAKLGDVSPNKIFNKNKASMKLNSSGWVLSDGSTQGKKKWMKKIWPDLIDEMGDNIFDSYGNIKPDAFDKIRAAIREASPDGLSKGYIYHNDLMINLIIVLENTLPDPMKSNLFSSIAAQALNWLANKGQASGYNQDNMDSATEILKKYI